MNIEHKCKKVVETHNDRSLTGRAKSYFFKAKEMNKHIMELRDEVKESKIRFLVSSSLELKFLR